MTARACGIAPRSWPLDRVEGTGHAVEEERALEREPRTLGDGDRLHVFRGDQRNDSSEAQPVEPVRDERARRLGREAATLPGLADHVGDLDFVAVLDGPRDEAA